MRVAWALTPSGANAANSISAIVLFGGTIKPTRRRHEYAW